MELVNHYLSISPHAIFFHLKELWNEQAITATPDMAALIEEQGIDRHTYKEQYYSKESYTFEGAQEFYRMCMGFLILLIDKQDFHAIPQVFEYEEMIRSWMEAQDS